MICIPSNYQEKNLEAIIRTLKAYLSVLKGYTEKAFRFYEKILATSKESLSVLRAFTKATCSWSAAVFKHMEAHLK